MSGILLGSRNTIKFLQVRHVMKNLVDGSSTGFGPIHYELVSDTEMTLEVEGRWKLLLKAEDSSVWFSELTGEGVNWEFRGKLDAVLNIVVGYLVRWTDMRLDGEMLVRLAEL